MSLKNLINKDEIKDFLLFENVSVTNLLAGEEEIAEKFAEVRRQSFVNGRYAARKALAKLDSSFESFPIIVAEAGKMPLWPEGVVGSISHCDSATVAIVASKKDYLNLGVDIEESHRCHKKLWEGVFLQEEISYLESLEENDQVEYATLLFSAKESYFKLLNPLLRKWIGFDDAVVKINKENQKFQIVPQKDFLMPMHKHKVEGYYCLDDKYVFTYMSIA